MHFVFLRTNSERKWTMAQTDWQNALETIVRTSGGSLGGSDSDLAARMLQSASEATPRTGTDSASGPATGTEPVERMLTSAVGSFGEQANSLGEKLSELARISQAQARTVEENTAALSQSTASQAADAVKSAVSSLGGFSALSAGPAFLPLISGIAKLFGGGKAETSVTDVPFVRPAAARVDAGLAGNGSDGAIRYDGEGTPRLVTESASRATPQVNIHVQAIDSRSFLDHSEDIARAVREAMLESHMLSDVANDF